MRAFKSQGEFQKFKDAIKKRRALYRSLASRGLTNGDSSLNDLSHSIYYDMIEFLEVVSQGVDYTAYWLSHKALMWYENLSPVYADPSLEEPEGWDVFLEKINDISEDPEKYLYTNEVESVVKDALENYKEELMAVNAP